MDGRMKFEKYNQRTAKKCMSLRMMEICNKCWRLLSVEFIVHLRKSKNNINILTERVDIPSKRIPSA